jgi:hypothetical protein
VRDTDTVGTTSNHPFWSVDRQEYVQAGQLAIGERLQTFSGDTKRVVSKLARPGPQPVYNLEVFVEHVYYVGKDGLLVHNSREYSLGNVSTGEGRVHITYRGTKYGGEAYTGYASLPAAEVAGLSKPAAQRKILEARYKSGFSAEGLDAEPTVVYFGRGKLGKQTGRGLEQHYYFEDLNNGLTVANAQKPVGPNNAKRALYERALRDYQMKYGKSYYWWDE